MEELNPQEQKVAKDIVAKVVIKVAHIQRVLLKSGIVPSPESIWTLSDLRQQIWNDMKANPEFIETIKKVSTCGDAEKAINETLLPESLEGYAKQLCDMITPSDIPTTKDTISWNYTDPSSKKAKAKSKRSSKKKDAWAEKLIAASLTWNTGTGALAKRDWKRRYKAVYEGLLATTPKWKRNVIEKDSEDRLSVEFSKNVISIAEDFQQFYELLSKMIEDKVGDKSTITEMSYLIDDASDDASSGAVVRKDELW